MALYTPLIKKMKTEITKIARKKVRPSLKRGILSVCLRSRNHYSTATAAGLTRDIASDCLDAVKRIGYN